MRSSWAESRVLSAIAQKFTYSIGAGPSSRIQFPDSGPYDERMGYALLPGFLNRLEHAGFVIETQARISSFAASLARFDLYPIYREKNQAGLEIVDRRGDSLYSARFPHEAYKDFDSIPSPVVQTLLFIENRHLLDSSLPYQNPAVEWERLAHAAVGFGIHKIDRHYSVIGGSTLATQLEKLRHSPEGRTDSPTEKLRQMASASLRVYEDGPRTLNAQRDVILDYINSIPLSATPGHGEVSGLADGLSVWYDTDFEEANRLLAVQDEATLSPREMKLRARAYREVLSLFLALRQPTRYLLRDPAALAAQTDRYLRALYDGHVISAGLRDAALQERISPRAAPAPPAPNFADHKAAQAIRMRLLDLLGLNGTYRLDRLDLKVHTTIDRGVQNSVSDFLQQMADTKQATAAGLVGFQLLPPTNATGDVIYSFTLYERGQGVNYLRAQTDNLNQPLNINDGTKLQLGSTAKLRTMINYLQIVQTLHDQYAGFSPAQLARVQPGPGDNITAWAVQYLASTEDHTLEPMLKAALNRQYSGNPGEYFFTAGGQHVFENFEREENFEVMPVSEGFQRSVNLVFVRVMRDVENYYKWRIPGVTPAILTDPNDPARVTYLKRFADAEGSTFLQRFWDKYHGQTPDQALETMVTGVNPAPWRIAVIYRSVRPNDGISAFSAFLIKHVPAALLANQDIFKLYSEYGPDKFNLSDRGYLAHVHPLELWLLAYLEQHPQAKFSEALAASTEQRQEVYGWLFRPKEFRGQNLRIGIILEQDAFQQIWKAWKALGYPFDYLVPSYATAIGVSGDTPSALAELAGIIANNGTLYPVEDVQKLSFAAGTPMATEVAPKQEAGEQVLSPVIARLVREQMNGVVENGTGRRALGAFHAPDGTVLALGGKTGTGDNRFKVFSRGGGLISDRPVNRTATFVFIVGDRLFGTVTAFVPSKNANDYTFTSALAVQLLKDLAPRIEPLLKP